MSASDRAVPVSGRVHAPDPGRPGNLAAAELALAETMLRGLPKHEEIVTDQLRPLLSVLLAEYDRRGELLLAYSTATERLEEEVERQFDRAARAQAVVHAAGVAVERRDQIGHDKPACYCPEGQPRDGQCMPCAPIDAVCSEYCLACALDALAAAVRAHTQGETE